MSIRWVYILSCVVLLVSCGEQNPNAVDLDLNRPFITRIVPGDKKLTIYFVAQNREYGFDGYNIYFADDRARIREQLVLSPTLVKPTIKADSTSSVVTYSFTIEHNVTSYKLASGAAAPGNVSIFNGVGYYFWVSAYRALPEKESVFDLNYTASAYPRPEILSYSAAENTGLSFPDAVGRLKFTNAGGFFCVMETNGGGVQDMGGASSLADIVTAPTNGYSSSPCILHTGHLYAVETSTAVYAKIYVRSVAGTSNAAVIDYCYQPTANVTSY